MRCHLRFIKSLLIGGFMDTWEDEARISILEAIEKSQEVIENEKRSSDLCRPEN